MLEIILWILLAAVVAFLAVIFVRAAMFKPKPERKSSGKQVIVNEEKTVQDMVEMIRCKTVSYNDVSLLDKAEFKKFQELLPKIHPEIHSRLSCQFIGVNGMLYHWKGKKEGRPVVLMSHYDVVPVEESQWEKPAFEGIVEDGVLWGRGTLDTKGTLCGIMEAAEQLLKEGYVPEHDIYFAFSGQEEINGPSCPSIVDWFEIGRAHV